MQNSNSSSSSTSSTSKVKALASKASKPAKAPAKASKAKAPAKGAKASKAPAAPAPKLTPNQLRFLAAIGAAKAPIGYKGLRAVCNVRKGLSKAIGTPSKASSAPHTLLALGLVQVVNASVPYTFSITPAGKAALPKTK